MKAKANKGGSDVVSINGHLIDLLLVTYVGLMEECDGVPNFPISFGHEIFYLKSTPEQRQKLIERLGWEGAEEL